MLCLNIRKFLVVGFQSVKHLSPFIILFIIYLFIYFVLIHIFYLYSRHSVSICLLFIKARRIKVVGTSLWLHAVRFHSDATASSIDVMCVKVENCGVGLVD